MTKIRVNIAEDDRDKNDEFVGRKTTDTTLEVSLSEWRNALIVRESEDNDYVHIWLGADYGWNCWIDMRTKTETQ